MTVWTSTDFEGFYPVGTAAVVVADTAEQAHQLLADALKQRGLATGDFTVQPVATDQPQAVILRDGDY